MAKNCSPGKSRGGSMSMGKKSVGSNKSLKSIGPTPAGVRKAYSGNIKPTDKKGTHS